jgi:hypothetical protein
VYRGDFLFQSTVDEAMALQRVEALELRRHNDGGEGLTATAWMIVSYCVEVVGWLR